jgi:hypothetical protein
MANGKSSAGFWLLISTLLVGGGVGIYFLLRKPKEEGEKSEEELKREEEEKKRLEDEKNKVDEKPKNDTSSTNTYVAPKSFTFPFTTEAEGNKFRAFVIAKDPTFAKKIDLSATGKLNSYVQKAWEKYGAEYQKSPAVSTTSTTATTNLSKNIDTIIGASMGAKAEKTYLLKTNVEYVNKWADAIKNKKNAFIWANQVYRTKTGDKVLEYNPIGRKYYAKITGEIGKLNPSDDSTAVRWDKGKELGKVTSVSYNNGVWLYIPSMNIYKWYKVDYVTTTKPSSSFSGGEEEIWAGFDNNFDITFK